MSKPHPDIAVLKIRITRLEKEYAQIQKQHAKGRHSAHYAVVNKLSNDLEDAKNEFQYRFPADWKQFELILKQRKK